MLIRDKKEFGLGLMMTISFLVVLALMFMPLFNGENALQASDRLFNSISKASTYYFDEVIKKVEEQRGHELTITAPMSTDARQTLLEMLSQVDVKVSIEGEAVVVSGGMGKLLTRIVEDARLMYNNKGDVLQETYGMPPREAMYMWWKFLKSGQKNLKEQKEFKTAAVFEEVLTKAVDVGYNYYGIEGQSAKERAGILTFALVFYVVYTLWWGYAIFFMAEGIGLAMKKGAKKEV